MQTPLEILYVGSGGEQSTSMMKARALRRLGHNVRILNLNAVQPASIWLQRVNNWTGYRLMQRRVEAFVSRQIGSKLFDLAWVDGGQFTGRAVLACLRKHCRQVVNYNHDDPTGNRDGNVWATFKRAVPDYDLLVTVRRETELELKAFGARRVLRVWRSYDEIEHRPRELSADDHVRWDSQVVFAGTWMPERGAFMADLIRRGLPLAIYGDFWSKAPEWPAIRSSWRGPAVYGDDYAKAIQCSKIALGLLSKGNRDRHTTRTAEIPAIGGVFCAERTDEHLELFHEGTEAVFWSDAAECVRVCRELIADENRRRSVASAGRTAVVRHGLGHEMILDGVLRQL